MVCVVEYLGSAYAGFQSQPGKVTVQSSLERAIEQVTGSRVSVCASGRTDAGAHALHQVVSFATESALRAEVLLPALNANLPRDMTVTSVAEAASDFHPRHDALSRTYRYLIWNRELRSPFWNDRAAHIKTPLDEAAMSRAAALLVGNHDFGAFVPSALPGSHVRSVKRVEVRREEHLVTIEIEGRGFMKQMVRCIAGTLVRVGQGTLSLEEFGSILARRDRTLSGDTLPAGGLYLTHVTYSNSSELDASRHDAPLRREMQMGDRIEEQV